MASMRHISWCLPRSLFAAFVWPSNLCSLRIGFSIASNMSSTRTSVTLLLISQFFGAAMSWEAPLFRGSRISQSELDDLSKKAEILSKHHNSDVMPVVSGCSTCAKTYSESCPVNWELTADDACHAPSGYSGYCAQGLKFDGWSVESKIVAEMSCSMCWPCSDVSALNDAAVVE